MTTFSALLSLPLSAGDQDNLLNFCRTATSSDTVFKEECCMTFVESGCEEGIYTSLKNFNCLGRSAVKEGGYYLNVQTRKELRDEFKDGQSVAPPTPPQKLGINIEGGYQDDSKRFKTITTYKLAYFQSSSNSLAAVDVLDVTKSITDLAASAEFSQLNALNSQVLPSALSIVNHKGAAVVADLSSWELNEDIPVSKYAEKLPFVDNGKMVSPDPKQVRQKGIKKLA